MKRPTVLIGGGYDKGSEYTEWINSFDGKVKKLILLGDTKEKIAADAEKCGFKDYMFVDSFEEAVLTCSKNCRVRRGSSAFTCMCKLGYVPEL